VWAELRADAQAERDQAEAAGADTGGLDEAVAELDQEITRSGMRGKVMPTRQARRHRSTRRRQDAPDLPRRTMAPTTVGKTYTAPDGSVFRPSMFLTLTCPSYGRVREDGTPASPGDYDYIRAARDALHFAALFDRFVQNLRRFAGYDVQYFAAVEPQRRLAPHIHVAIRGTISRAELRQVLAATYHQVWWPSTAEVKHDDVNPPIWHEPSGNYLDPATGEVLPTWDQALDAIGEDDEPLHVARFGAKFDAQGVLTSSRDANRCIGYLTKYLTKQLGDCHTTGTDAQQAHAARLVQALRYEPCSPRCANWLRYGIQPHNARLGLRPGHCRGKAHRPEHLGYAGRRVLVSRKWSGKSLADHRADRKTWLLQTLGFPPEDTSRYTWAPVLPGDHDHMPPAQRMLHVLADRQRWQAALAQARARASGGPPGQHLSATGQAA
jgi:replication initiator protein RepSA